jgi:uncharacterized membrane protein YgcG
VPPERASVAAEADSTTSPITNFRETISEKLSGVNGDDRTPPSLAAESSDDSSIESSTVSRRISSKSLSQLSVAELDDLRQQLLSLPTASAPPIVGVGANGGSLGVRADVGTVPAVVATQPSGSSIIPEVPVHPLGNGASGGQLLSQPSRTVFDVELDSLLASDPSIPCPPEARAALIRLKSHDHNGLELLEPVPAASSSRKNVVVTYAVSDQEVVNKWNAPLSEAFKSQLRSAVQAKRSSQEVPIEVKALFDRQIFERSGHTIRDINEFTQLSIDGFVEQTGLSGISDMLGAVPRTSSEVLTLDPLPRDLRADSLGFGLVRQTLSPEDWKDARAVVAPCVKPLIEDRSLVSYALGLALLVFGAAQVFCHTLVGFLLEVGEQQRTNWFGRITHDFKALTDGSNTGFNGDFVPTVAMFLLMKNHNDVAHMHGTRALCLLTFAKVTSRELSAFFKVFHDYPYLPTLSSIENYRALIAVANNCNYWKGTAGRDDPTCHFIGEQAVTTVFVSALCLVFVGDHALNLNTTYILQHFKDKEFPTVHSLYLALKVAEANFHLRASSEPPSGGLRSAHVVSSSHGGGFGGGFGGQGYQGGKGSKGSKGSKGTHGTAPSSSLSDSSSTGGGPMSSLSSNSSVPAPAASVKPSNYRDAIGLVIRFFKIPNVVQFLKTRMWDLYTFFERVLLPAVDPTVGPELSVLRMLPTSVHPNAMGWMFSETAWLPYDDGHKHGPITREYLKYSLAVVRNSLDPDNAKSFKPALSSAVSKSASSGQASGSTSASAGSRHHKRPAQVNAALLAPSPAAAAPAPTQPLVSTGAGVGGGSADGVTITALLARVAQLEANDKLKDQRAEQQRVESLEKELALRRRLDDQRLDEQRARRAFTAAQDPHGGDVHGSSLSLVPHPHYNRGGGAHDC